MTRGLYGWKPPSGATDYLKEQDHIAALNRYADARNERMQQSRDWLANYRSQTRFNWSGKFPVIIKETVDEEAIEAAFGQTARAAKERHEEGMGDAPEECSAPEARSIGADAAGRPGEGAAGIGGKS